METSAWFSLGLADFLGYREGQKSQQAGPFMLQQRKNLQWMNKKNNMISVQKKYIIVPKAMTDALYLMARGHSKVMQINKWSN